ELYAGERGALPDWRAVAAAARSDPRVQATAPFVLLQGLVGRDDMLRGALLRGIDPAAEAGLTTLAGRLDAAGTLRQLAGGGRRIVLGAELARALRVRAGDAVAVLVPAPADATAPQAGTLPRSTVFTVAGVFDAGHYEYDNTLALVHLDDAAELAGLRGPSAVALRVAEPLAGPAVAAGLAARLPGPLLVRDWTQVNRTWFEAVALQKRMLGLILVLIVAVAAFNLVSTLVMTVTDKRADIAVLRTLGASPRSVMGIFFVQGAAAGVLGTAGGVALGVAVAAHLGTLVPALERLLGATLLPASVYYIDRMPSQPLASDIVPIALASLVLAFVATLYPSWRASRVQPAVELRGE
ncbi:MAG: FtsX-like permease family protein, partial [Pseudomonadota bacterium]